MIDETDRLLAQSFQDWLAQVLAATQPSPRSVPETTETKTLVPLCDSLAPVNGNVLVAHASGNIIFLPRGDLYNSYFNVTSASPAGTRSSSPNNAHDTLVLLLTQRTLSHTIDKREQAPREKGYVRHRVFDTRGQ